MNKRKCKKWVITYTIKHKTAIDERRTETVYRTNVTSDLAISDLKFSLVKLQGIADSYDDVIILDCIASPSIY